jgi:hypothetical protein
MNIISICFSLGFAYCGFWVTIVFSRILFLRIEAHISPSLVTQGKFVSRDETMVAILSPLPPSHGFLNLLLFLPAIRHKAKKYQLTGLQSHYHVEDIQDSALVKPRRLCAWNIDNVDLFPGGAQ